MKVALAQINTVVGDFEQNLRIVQDWLGRARAAGADLVVFPELTFAGYPPKDLLEKRSFVDKNLEILQRFKRDVRGIAAVVGYVSRNESGSGKPLFNSAALVADGQILHTTHKCLLPTYDVFDEARHFEPSSRALGLVAYRDRRIALTICEDFWNDAQLFPQRMYRYDPVEDMAGQGTDLFININASPFTLGKPGLRRRIVTHAAGKYGVPVLLVNQVGGYDEIVFDGGSLIAAAGGELVAQGRAFEEDLVVADLTLPPAAPPEAVMEPAEQIYRALVLGTRDYTRKCGFHQVVIGLSGGVDSALVACIAAEALGPENVTGIAMPSMYSAPASLADAEALACNLGIRLETIPIAAVYDSYLQQLRTLFAGRRFDTTEENLQARIRGNLLMAFSNKFGSMVLSTGNKSELAVGYSTLYGDMCGGLAVISDLLKTQVYEVCRWINRARPVIPESTLTKAPSAELRPNQTDQDELPPYDVLDAVLRLYIEEQQSRREIIERGFDTALVDRIVGMVDRNEYKRRQAPPGLKVTGKAFGLGRRLPIVHRFTY
ncbi:MAG TPA: NAD+ synthase [Acidobacteriota bacterium]|nr:NAD+ synthase [Acidobacteriota bacterium]HQM62169.1 NAD+ synthase [Acidobacteriota bacterium]